MTLLKKKEKKAHIKRSRLGEFWHQFKKNKGAMVGLCMCAVLLFLVVFGSTIWDYKEDVTKLNVREKLAGI